MKTGFIIFAHGSAVEEANQAVRATTRRFAEAGGYAEVETAFLELAEPDLPEAIGRLVRRGVERVVVVPYFLTLGRHLKQDLPRIVEDCVRIHMGVAVTVTAPLDGHPALIDVLVERSRSAI